MPVRSAAPSRSTPTMMAVTGADDRGIGTPQADGEATSRRGTVPAYRGVARRGPPGPAVTRAVAGLAVALLAGALAACTAVPAPGDGSFARATHQCMAVNPGFTDAWGCIRKLITREDVGAEDADRSGLKALGDGLTEQLADEALTSAEARARLLAGLPAAPAP